MPNHALEPLRIPNGFWARDEVTTALHRRDIGQVFCLLRRYAGASQTRIGIAVGLAQGTVSLYMNGQRTVTTIDLLERVATGLDLPGHARLRLGLAPQVGPATTATIEPAEEHPDTKRRTVVSLGLAAALSPTTIGAVLRGSAAEAMEFTRQATMSSVGSATLDHLGCVMTDLDRSYSSRPPAERFAVAHAYRQRVGQLCQGKRTLKETRELYVYAAWLSEMLAWLAHDLGSPLAAEAYAIDAFEHADQAGHNELCAWAADAMASIAMYTGQPGRAVTAAAKGLDRAPTEHPLTVRLQAQAARAHARLGDADTCATFFHAAEDSFDRLPARAPVRFALDTSTLASYALTAYASSAAVWLGDFQRAELEARNALAVHEAAPASTRSPSREAIARIDLALALAGLRRPEEAVDLGLQALSSTRVVASVITRADELRTALRSRYSDLNCVQDFSAQYRHLSQPATTAER
ncbi:MAG: helix-turn-helix domain-containing protein [Dactylosporangium sp.]|nr:helix-turn-helix domain-containing protein [Dactylosporangium sp.]NNJ60996.1 helix-turn-helix domain-containing protein [Dactylosporangium sp.]